MKRQYRIKKWYSKKDSRWLYTPQVKDWFLFFWTYWKSITGLAYYDLLDAEIVIDKCIKDDTSDWPEDEIIEYPRFNKNKP